MDFKEIFGFIKSKANPKCSFVVVAAGNSERMGNDKMLIELSGKPVIVRTLEALEKSDYCDEVILVTREDKLESMAALVKEYNLGKVAKVVAGGLTRSESCLAGVCAAKKNAKLIAIHDGARPFISEKLIKNCVFGAVEKKAAVPGIKINDTIKATESGIICGDIDRDATVRIQTPQIFDADLIKGALSYVVSKNIAVTDDSSAVECLGVKAKVVEGDPDNIKLTTPRDVQLAEMILSQRSST